jgi:MoxR-like ATPase
VVRLAADLPQARPQWKDASKTIETVAISNTGKRALMTARGEVFSVPVEHGSVRNLTRTDGRREYAGLWSPGGEQVAYLVQEAEGQSLALIDQVGLGQERRIPLGPDYYELLDWSHGAQTIAYADNHLNLWLVDLAANLESDFSRIQFTPDLLPSDITGTEIYIAEAAGDKFQFQPGPVFGNLILADEINRAPAKAQSALLEAMEERQVTVSGTSHKLPELFLVLATQNPIEQEGTYPLPEAQMDRFLLHVYVDYASDADEQKILHLVRGEDAGTGAVNADEIPAQAVLDAPREVLKVEVSDPVERYMVALIAATRRPGEYADSPLADWISVGASPRGTLALDRASRAHAWMDGRNAVTPDDVKAVLHACLRHRVIISYDAEADGVTRDVVLDEVLKQVAVA